MEPGAFRPPENTIALLMEHRTRSPLALRAFASHYYSGFCVFPLVKPTVNGIGLVEPTITHELLPLPARRDDVHKGDVGRLVVVGGQADEVMMVGAPALTANAALRSGVGLVQIVAPEGIRAAVATLTPCATVRTLPDSASGVIQALREYQADVLAIGPGMGVSLTPRDLVEVLLHFAGPVVIDADGLNNLAATPPTEFPNRSRMVMTPHPGEARRLLASRGVDIPDPISPTSRHDVACRLVEAFGCVVVLKGHRTLVTDGERLFVNHTGNAGMATAGAGDVLTGVIAALIGQSMPVLEAAMLGVHLHGLAGDFAAQELGRHAMTAMDIIDYLPDAFCDYEASTAGTTV